MKKLSYREGDRTFPHGPVQSIEAEHFMNLNHLVQEEGMNVLEGLCFDRNGDLYVCNPPKGEIYKVNMETKEGSFFLKLPLHILPAALKIHKDGRLFVAAVNSDEGSMIAIFSKEGELLQKIPMQGHRIDDLVFDRQGGFYCTDLTGTFENPCAGIFYVHPDYETVEAIVPEGLIKSNGIVLSKDEKELWFTEFGAGKLDCIRLGTDLFSGSPYKPYTPYYFTGMEGPDSMTMDEDGNLYVAMTGQGRCLIFNPGGFPIGEFCIPERKEGRMLKSTHVAIRPETDEAYLCTADMKDGTCSLYRARVYAKAYKSFQFQ